MHMLLPVQLALIKPYTDAADLLRPILKEEAPTAAELVATGMTNRRAEAIAEEYLEFNGYPTLATCRRRRLAVKARRKGRVAVALFPSASKRRLREPNDN
jgi:hypothetical protein